MIIELVLKIITINTSQKVLNHIKHAYVTNLGGRQVLLEMNVATALRVPDIPIRAPPQETCPLVRNKIFKKKTLRSRIFCLHNQLQITIVFKKNIVA